MPRLTLLLVIGASCWMACAQTTQPVRSAGETCGEPEECESNLCYEATCFEVANDDDLDGLTNQIEANLTLNPKNPDSDGDGIWDAVEVGADLSTPADEDGDGKIDAKESSDPSADSDGDCIPDQKDPDDSIIETSIKKIAQLTCCCYGLCSEEQMDAFESYECQEVDGVLQVTCTPPEPDSDGDGLGDSCDWCPPESGGDADGDGVCGNEDNCPLIPNAVQGPDDPDGDQDGLPDLCDPCPLDDGGDADGDTLCDSDDPCPDDPANDADGDGICAPEDPCPLVAGPTISFDLDGDGVPEACVACIDPDGDGVGDSSDGQACPSGDNCPGEPNPEQIDTDADGLGDACDDCLDIDGDGLCVDADCDDADPTILECPVCDDVDADGICQEEDCNDGNPDVLDCPDETVCYPEVGDCVPCFEDPHCEDDGDPCTTSRCDTATLSCKHDVVNANSPLDEQTAAADAGCACPAVEDIPGLTSNDAALFCAGVCPHIAECLGEDSHTCIGECIGAVTQHGATYATLECKRSFAALQKAVTAWNLDSPPPTLCDPTVLDGYCLPNGCPLSTTSDCQTFCDAIATCGVSLQDALPAHPSTSLQKFAALEPKGLCESACTGVSQAYPSIAAQAPIIAEELVASGCDVDLLATPGGGHPCAYYNPVNCSAWSVPFGGQEQGFLGVYRPHGVTWNEAAFIANALGGHLAALNSPEEDAFVFDQVASRVWESGSPEGPWIGGHRVEGADVLADAPEAGWEWVTEEPWEYTHWAPEALSAPDESKNALRYHDDRPTVADWGWKDHDGSETTWSTTAFLVEFPSPFEMPPCYDPDGDKLCGSPADGCPFDGMDTDGDGACDNDIDNCPEHFNYQQLDLDRDGIGLACDTCLDTDEDGVCAQDDCSDNSAIVGACSADTFCNVQSGVCVECLEDADCPAAEGECTVPYCVPGSHTCTHASQMLTGADPAWMAGDTNVTAFCDTRCAALTCEDGLDQATCKSTCIFELSAHLGYAATWSCWAALAQQGVCSAAVPSACIIPHCPTEPPAACDQYCETAALLYVAGESDVDAWDAAILDGDASHRLCRRSCMGEIAADPWREADLICAANLLIENNGTTSQLMHTPCAARPCDPEDESIRCAVWPVSEGGNGHYYSGHETISTFLWTTASQEAHAQGGHLAVPSDQAENDWLKAQAFTWSELWYPGNDQMFGPFLGGYQARGEPWVSEDSENQAAEGWHWVTGERWSAESWSDDPEMGWAPNEPNNQYPPEDFLRYLLFGQSVPDDETLTAAHVGWNDDALAWPSLAHGYLAEYAPTYALCRFEDADYDEVCDQDDNCPTLPNQPQTDTDGDGVGDACDSCPEGPPGEGLEVSGALPVCQQHCAEIFPCEEASDDHACVAECIEELGVSIANLATWSCRAVLAVEGYCPEGGPEQCHQAGCPPTSAGDGTLGDEGTDLACQALCDEAVACFDDATANLTPVDATVVHSVPLCTYSCAGLLAANPWLANDLTCSTEALNTSCDPATSTSILEACGPTPCPPLDTDCSEWTTASGGNGHFYEVVALPDDVTSWYAAQELAEAAGGHLATLTSHAENDFVFETLVSNPSTWNAIFGPWIGGFQPEDHEETTPGTFATGWTWVTGEPWDADQTSWFESDPNNAEGVEDFLLFGSLSGPPDDTWMDLAGTGVLGDFAVSHYVVEYAPTWQRCDDADHDTVCDTVDRCPTTPDLGQPDTDRDGIGDTCDHCPDGVLAWIPGPTTDHDADGCRDADEDDDDDNDGVPDGDDCAPTDASVTAGSTDCESATCGEPDGCGGVCSGCPVPFTCFRLQQGDQDLTLTPFVDNVAPGVHHASSSFQTGLEADSNGNFFLYHDTSSTETSLLLTLDEQGGAAPGVFALDISGLHDATLSTKDDAADTWVDALGTSGTLQATFSWNAGSTDGFAITAMPTETCAVITPRLGENATYPAPFSPTQIFDDSDAVANTTTDVQPSDVKPQGTHGWRLGYWSLEDDANELYDAPDFTALDAATDFTETEGGEAWVYPAATGEHAGLAAFPTQENQMAAYSPAIGGNTVAAVRRYEAEYTGSLIVTVRLSEVIAAGPFRASLVADNGLRVQADFPGLGAEAGLPLPEVDHLTMVVPNVTDGQTVDLVIHPLNPGEKLVVGAEMLIHRTVRRLNAVGGQSWDGNPPTETLGLGSMTVTKFDVTTTFAICSQSPETCAAHTTCDGEACICSDTCGAQECGVDGCGRSCGICADGTCNGEGACAVEEFEVPGGP